MKAWPEEGVVFPCRGWDLVGIVHHADGPRGVLVVVGGPQYRAGSHRQFTLLARRLAAAGVPVLRFDCRGHGDSDGTRTGFEHISDDIDAAIAAFQRHAQGVEELVILGLCDAASAALLHPGLPACVRGLVLLNPWVTEAAVAPETMLRHYYLRRMLAPQFWRKLLAGGVSGRASLREAGASLAAAARGRLAARGRDGGGQEDQTLAGRMASGLSRFRGPVLLVTSGQDLTAGEFLDTARRDARWRRLLAEPRVTHEHLPDANHTFSSLAWRARVEDDVLEWLARW